MTRTTSPWRGQRLTGMALIVAGITFLLDHSGIVAVQDLWHYWPVLLVVLGVVRMHDARSARDITSGLWSVVIGAWLLASLEGWFGIDFRNSWPALLIAWGVIMLSHPVFERRFPSRQHDDVNEHKENAHGH